MGDYLITVTITDTLATITGTFLISVINTPPYFVSTVPADFTMKFNNTYVYYLPKYADNEGHAVTVLIDSIPAGQVSAFTTVIDNSYIEFTPNDWKQFKDYNLFITLTDGITPSAQYPLLLTMTNSAPIFQTKFPVSVKVQLSKE